MALSKIDSPAIATLSDNIAFASGKGLDFSATSDGGGIATQTEVFSNYEQGRWTPRIEGSTTAGTTTYTAQYGSYTVIGNTCTIRGYCNWSAATGTGTLLMKGLPYDIAVQNSYEYLAAGTCFANDVTWTSGYTQINAYAYTGDYLQFYVTQRATAWSSVVMNTTGGFIFSVSYPIA